MKHLNLFSIVVFAMSFALMGCGNTGSSSRPVTTVDGDVFTIPIGTDLDVNPFEGYGGTVTTQLLNIHPGLLNYFTAASMELDLGTVIGNHTDLDANQGGDLVIHKLNVDGSRSYSFFTSGGNTLEDVRENYWSYNIEGKLVWRGVFEGPTGSLVVVVDGVYESGDGNDPFDYMSGSVWFRPWPVVSQYNASSNTCVMTAGGICDYRNPSGTMTRCWDVSIGPYDCRFSVSADSKTVSTTGNAYATGEYYKVADFIDLSREETFKESY